VSHICASVNTHAPLPSDSAVIGFGEGYERIRFRAVSQPSVRKRRSSAMITTPTTTNTVGSGWPAGSLGWPTASFCPQWGADALCG
jgi:hypothetical protein